MQTNANNVNKRQWRRWSAKAQRVFNDLYECMKLNAKLFQPPTSKAYKPPSARQWEVTCWNAAWIAADAVDDDVPPK